MDSSDGCAQKTKESAHERFVPSMTGAKASIHLERV